MSLEHVLLDVELVVARFDGLRLALLDVLWALRAHVRDARVRR